eukprot:TRINITY_DN8240_c0_g1_i12.p1 TRINITY_DN8240_c0_g1~~TRINITY_DN8240_c0_g1_i12.p1  ORF type:complete len:308 (-),score=36.69 TRINITY_DN8240_c0_g1_i12:170-1093(-)
MCIRDRYMGLMIYNPFLLYATREAFTERLSGEMQTRDFQSIHRFELTVTHIYILIEFFGITLGTLTLILGWNDNLLQFVEWLLILLSFSFIRLVGLFLLNYKLKRSQEYIQSAFYISEVLPIVMQYLLFLIDSTWVFCFICGNLLLYENWGVLNDKREFKACFAMVLLYCYACLIKYILDAVVLFAFLPLRFYDIGLLEAHSHNTPPHLFKELMDKLTRGIIERAGRQKRLCAICLDSFREDQTMLFLTCDPRHNFHSTCISTWLKQSAHCPICKQPIRLKEGGGDEAVARYLERSKRENGEVVRIV